MSKPNGSTTERYRIKDFSPKEIAQRLVNVVCIISIIKRLTYNK
jgi:hypothetical protein